MKNSIKAILIGSILTASIPSNAESTWYQVILKAFDYYSGAIQFGFGLQAGGAHRAGILGENIKKRPYLFGCGIAAYAAALCLGAPNKKYREIPFFLKELRNKAVRGETISEFDIAQATLLKLPNAPQRPHLHPEVQGLVGRIRQYNSTHALTTGRVRVAGDLPYDVNDQQALLQGIDVCYNRVANRVTAYWLGCAAASAGMLALNYVFGNNISTQLQTVTTVKS